jgi:hypothetical protein
VQYRWYLSKDEQVTIDDTALGPEGTLYEILYQGSGTTVSQPVTLPAFPDPVAHSYIGLIVDPYEFAFDPDRTNKAGSAPSTFTVDPPHGFYDTVCDSYLDAVHLSAAVNDGSLEVAVHPTTGCSGGGRPASPGPDLCPWRRSDELAIG